MVITSQGQMPNKPEDRIVRPLDQRLGRPDPKPIPPGGGFAQIQGEPHPGTLEGGVKGPDLPVPGEGHPAVDQNRGLHERYTLDEQGRINEGGKTIGYGSAQPMVYVADRPESILRDVVALSPVAEMPETVPTDATISVKSAADETLDTHLIPFRGGYIVSGPLADKLAAARGLIVDQALGGIEGMDLHPLKQEEVMKMEKPPGIVAPSRTYGGDLLSKEEAERLGHPEVAGQTRNVPIGDDPQNPSEDTTPVPMANETEEQKKARESQAQAEISKPGTGLKGEPPLKATPPTGTSESPSKSEPTTKDNKKS